VFVEPERAADVWRLDDPWILERGGVFVEQLRVRTDALPHDLVGGEQPVEFELVRGLDDLVLVHLQARALAAAEVVLCYHADRAERERTHVEVELPRDVSKGPGVPS
jgi:hypothetical protein